MTRDEVLDTLERYSKLARKGLRRDEIPVHMMANNRIAVILPSGKYTPDERLKLDGKFQVAMTLSGAHGFLDFAADGTWTGASTPLKGGFR